MRDESNDREREQQVGREAREDLHDGLRVTGQARVHPDLDPDRHPDDGRNRHYHGDAREGDSPKTARIYEGTQPDAVVQVGQALPCPPADDRNDNGPKDEVAEPAPPDIFRKRVLGEPEGPGRLVQRPPDGCQAMAERAWQLRLAQEVQYRAPRLLAHVGILHPELLGPRHKRAEEQDVDADHDHDHGRDRDADLAHRSLADGGADVTADAGR